MTNKTTAALKLAEEAMTSNMRLLGAKALAAIREALADHIAASGKPITKPVKQEPVAWLNPHNQAVIDARKKKQIGEGKGYPNFSIPLYAAPVSAKREWVDLTDDEILKAIRGIDGGFEGFRALIAAFKAKNEIN